MNQSQLMTSLNKITNQSCKFKYQRQSVDASKPTEKNKQNKAEEDLSDSFSEKKQCNETKKLNLSTLSPVDKKTSLSISSPIYSLSKTKKELMNSVKSPGSIVYSLI